MFQPWRIITFVVSCTGIIIIAPYTGDPTWDYIDAGFMALLTFLTAPWAVGAIYKSIRKIFAVQKVFVALCLWFFSASWSYDIYLYFRDGYYPVTWYSNIFASSVLYLSAGLFWSLEFREDRGVIFSFMEQDWLIANTKLQFIKIFWYALPFMLLVSAIMLYFII